MRAANNLSLVGLFTLLSALAAACSAADESPAIATPTESFDASAATDASPAPPPPPVDAGAVDAASPDAADAGPPRKQLTIEFDYRFDAAGFFSVPDRKKALEAAGAIWSSRLQDQFEKIPAGTYAITRDPEDWETPAQPVTLTKDIGGVLIFVGSAIFADTVHARAASTVGLSGVTDVALRNRMRARYRGSNFEPWTGWISFRRDNAWHFDPAPVAGGAVPNDKVDFVSTALHEIGHVLGFGQAAAFDAFVSGQTFVGPAAMTLWGGPVPLSADVSHLPTNILFGGKEVLMDSASSKGERTFPTVVDLAMLEDIGYEL